jgi:DNA polymerase-3 subunit epsilon
MHDWADLAYVTPALYPELARQCRSLDQWMVRFGIGNFARHNALADAVSTAELLLRLRPRMAEKRVGTFKALHDADQAHRRATAFLGGM